MQQDKSNQTIIINSKIEITKSIFNENINFAITSEESPYTYIICPIHFIKKVDFSRTTFNSEVKFADVEFLDGADFTSAKFNKKILFYYVTFNELAYFGGWEETFYNKNGKFVGSGFTSGSIFRDSAIFFHNIFNCKADFNSTEFHKVTDFSVSQFNEDVSFSGVTRTKFEGNAIFEAVTFNKNAYFGGSAFNNDAIFIRARFLQFADFIWTTFNGMANFNECIFDKNPYFLETFFNKSINLNSARFNLIYIYWYQIKGKLYYDDWVYAKLINIYENMGRYEDADGAYYEFREQKRKHYRNLLKRAFEFILLDLTCGYGVKPFRAIIFLIVILLIFSGFYYNNIIINIKDKNKAKIIWNRFKNSLFISGSAFISGRFEEKYLSRDIFSIKIYYPVIKNKSIKYNYLEIKSIRYKTIALIERLLGWLILALFLVTLGKVWIR